MINNMPVPEPRQIPSNLQNGQRSEVPQVDIDVASVCFNKRTTAFAES